MQAALEQRLPKHLRCFRVLACFAYIRNPANVLTPLQLPSVHHNTSFDGCAHDAEENRMRKEFVRRSRGGLSEGHLYLSIRVKKSAALDYY